MNKRSKKLIAIVKYFHPVAAGIETNMLETYSVLVKKGWDVSILTSDYDYTTQKKLRKNENIRGIKVKRYSLTPLSFFPKIDNEANVIALHNFDIFPHF